MINFKRVGSGGFFTIPVVMLLLLGLATCPGCSSGATSGGSDNGTGGGSGGGAGADGGNTLLNEAAGYNGSLTGKVLDTQTTRASTVDASTAQDVPPSFDTATTRVEFRDLAGNPLVGEDGQPIEPVELNADGTFTAEGLPVGTDFTVCVDIHGDGSCDVENSVNIPNADPRNPGTGQLSNAKVDPLTTLVLAKLQALIEEKGIDPASLPISPVALVARVVEAYIHLFEESGIDGEVTLEDIETLSSEQLAQLFDEVIPAIAQTSMLTARGNLGLVNAEDVNSAALAVAEVFLSAGFPVADAPQGLDLSSLGSLPDIEATTMRELFAQGDPMTEDFAEVDGNPAPAQFPDRAFEPTIYFSTTAEPDRNFSDEEGEGGQGPGPHLPVIHDYLLIEMARLQLENRRISINDLHDLVTSLDDGMGARLTYFVFDPNFFGPPMTVFETADGAGKAVALNQMMNEINSKGFGQLDHEQMEARDAELRSMLKEILADTVQPSLDRLAGGFMSERIASINDLSATIRDGRAHLPFSRTGPSTFFVVADGDPFRQSATVSAVTVDAEVSAQGEVSSVVYNSAGEGKFYLLFTQGTEGEGTVNLMVREAGRPLHGPRGPVRLDMHDAAIFAAVNGEAFIDFVSETGNFFPGVSVAVVSSSFVPAPPPDPGVVQPASDEPTGPNQQIFVLATSPGPDAEPVRVDYDATTGVASYNSGGRFLLQFIPDTHETGNFQLFNEQTGRPAGQEDPANFFVPPPPPPDAFTPMPGDPNQPPPDGTQPPPDGGVADGTPPPDPSVPPAQVVDGTTDGTTDATTTDPGAGASTGTEPPTGLEGAVGDSGSFGGTVNQSGSIIVSIDAIAGLPIARQSFTHVFGTEVSNPRYNADGDPYFDDINGDGIQDADEPTSPFRPTLFKADDWRSTDIRMYYRRADNHAAVTFEEVDFNARSPMTMDGVALVSRNFHPRLNAFRFGRPNTALNLLTAFLPPDFFDGTHALTGDTLLDVYSAIAVINLMMDQVHNVQAVIDVDGSGPQTSRDILVDAHIFVPPIGDPFLLLIKGFAARSQILDADATIKVRDIQ
jgi:hypothetical protein